MYIVNYICVELVVLHPNNKLLSVQRHLLLCFLYFYFQIIIKHYPQLYNSSKKEKPKPLPRHLVNGCSIDNISPLLYVNEWEWTKLKNQTHFFSKMVSVI